MPTPTAYPSMRSAFCLAACRGWRGRPAGRWFGAREQHPRLCLTRPRQCARKDREISYSAPFTWLNTLSSIGAFLLGLSTLPFLHNVWKTAKIGKKIEVDDPWGYGRSLAWATSCPSPRHNFTTLPRIRSESPAFDPHYPGIAKREHAANTGRRDVVEAEDHKGDRS